MSDKFELPYAIFWDWDGTLVDSYSFLNDAHNHTLRTLGFEPFKGDEYKEYFGKPRETLYPAIYKDKCEQAKDVFQSYVTENSHKILPLKGGKDVLSLLHKGGVKMGIVSNKKASFIEKEVAHLEWDHYFSIIVGAGDAQADKPSSAPLLLALKRSGIDHKEKSVWYIGDTENDLACASEAGCKSLFLSGDVRTQELIEYYDPLFSFENHSQLKEFLVAI
ncbi:MAG: HAD family hydrolase [Alphaproteobacteria bacterium]